MLNFHQVVETDLGVQLGPPTLPQAQHGSHKCRSLCSSKEAAQGQSQGAPDIDQQQGFPKWLHNQNTEWKNSKHIRAQLKGGLSWHQTLLSKFQFVGSAPSQQLIYYEWS